jgi:hypothetical protein
VSHRSGKDRTGVVVAALLSVLGIDRDLVVEGYRWSDGEVERAWIEGSPNGHESPGPMRSWCIPGRRAANRARATAP